MGSVFPLSSISHPPQRFLQGSSPLSWSGSTACPGTPCQRSAQQHTGPSDGPLGRGPSTLLWRRTPAGCPVGGAVEHDSRMCACVLRRFHLCILFVFAQITLMCVCELPLTVWLIQLLGISGLPRSRTTLSFMLSTHGLSLRFPKGGSYSFTSANTKNEPVMSSNWSSLVIWGN